MQVTGWISIRQFTRIHAETLFTGGIHLSLPRLYQEAWQRRNGLNIKPSSASGIKPGETFATPSSGKGFAPPIRHVPSTETTMAKLDTEGLRRYSEFMVRLKKRRLLLLMRK